MNNVNQNDNLKKIAMQIFSGEITWEDARFKYGTKNVNEKEVPAIAEKTLRRKIIKLCVNDDKLAQVFCKYSTTRRQKRTNINVPAVIIFMIKNCRSFNDMVTELNGMYKVKMTKETLRTLVANELKKSDSEILVELMKEHNIRKKSKQTLLQPSELADINKNVEIYIKKHPEYTETLVFSESAIQQDINRIQSILKEVEYLKSTGMSEREICKKKKWGHEYISRQKRYLENYKFIQKYDKDKKDNSLER
jgi:hypothetical protein